MIEILQKPQDVVRAINECVDKKKKLNMDKAYLRLIDLYEISLFTAKALMGMKLHEAGDPKAAAAQEIKKLEEKLAAAKAKAEKNGCTLGADYVLMKGGQPVRAVRKMTAEEIDLIVRRVARIVKIGMFMDRYPSELSGGQQQRVAIARTLAPNPKVLFMDEPLSNLDAKLRLEMRSELQRLHLQTGSTFVYVTHDQMEAMTLATRICLMENGVLQQYDEPLTVYGKPSNLFVADFVGNPAINFIEAQGAQKQDGTVELTMLDGVKAAYTPGEPVNLREWFAREEKNAAAVSAAAQLIFAYAEAVVPKVSVLCGQAVGAAYSAMGSKAVGADAVYAWPKAYIAPINAEAAVRILEKEEIRAGKPVAELAKFYEENNGALAAAEEGLCDDVIEPAATRQMIAAALEMLMGKREVALPRKHGNLPL